MEELRQILKFYQEIGAGFLDTGLPREADKAGQMEQISSEINKCTKCKLYKTVTRYVVGEGQLCPDIMFIGEAPGQEEDLSGKPFVGKAGQLLDKIIARMGLSRETVYIGNIIKCRPPDNRDPEPEEVSACISHIKNQIRVLQPLVLVCLGKIALNNLMGENLSITRVRGQQFQFEGIPLIPTFHPAYIIRQKSREDITRVKWEVWNDMQKAMEIVREAKKG